LQNDLSALIDDRISPNCRGVPALVELHDAVKAAIPGFRSFLPKGRGRKPEPWHRIAQDLGPTLKEAIKLSGGKRAGFGKVTSPAVVVMSSALAWLGFEASPGAIVDAMRARKKPGK
jgi:hypothetical protein